MAIKAKDKEVIQIRIDAKQKKLIVAAAKKMGLSVSAWVRLTIFKAEREQRDSE